MLKVNNKKTIHQLVLSSIKEYKMRNIFTLITIILSVSLISGFAFLSSAIQETQNKELAKRQHVIYEDLTLTQIEAIKEHPEISFAKRFKRGTSFEVNDYIIVPGYTEDNEDEFLSLILVDGKYPKKMNEVLVYKEMLEKMGLEPIVGQTMTLSFLDGTSETFTVTGLMKSEADTDVFSVYFSEEYALNGEQLKDIPLELAVQIVDATQYNREDFLSLIRQIGLENEVQRHNVNENNAFVDSLDYDFREVTMISMIAFGILSVSVLVIYSIFYLSISERARQFGQLRTIGMTKKQVKKMVRKEGTILSLIGSGVGILIGAMFAYSLKPLGFNMVFFIMYSIAIMMANYVTVQLSIAKPAKLAASISPIEASKMNGCEPKNNQLNSKKLQRKLSPLSLSLIAARSNRKKSAMTVISLCLAGIVFICSTTILGSVNEKEYAKQSWFTFGEFVINLSHNAVQVNEYGQTGLQKVNPLSQQLESDLLHIEGVKDVKPFKNLNLTYTYHDMTSDDVAAPFTKEETNLLSDYVKEGELDYEKMVTNKEIIIVHNEIAKEIFGWEFELGDRITLKWYDGETSREEEFKIGAILKNTNALYRNSDVFELTYNAGWFMVPQTLLENMMMPNFNLSSRLVVSVNDYDLDGLRVEEEIMSLTETNPLIKVSTFRNQLEHSKEQYTMMYATFMGAATFVIMFSMINLLNTLISNAMVRKREYACLGAIGASNKQIRIMILGEGLYFALINLISTFTLGTLIGYSIVKALIWSGESYFEYKFPLISLIGYSMFVLIIPVIISLIIEKIISQKSLVERLREVE